MFPKWAALDKDDCGAARTRGPHQAKERSCRITIFHGQVVVPDRLFHRASSPVAQVMSKRQNGVAGVKLRDKHRF
jgi:hypothetical protein